ncbi:MAG TPA: SpoIIE family protein phosphatase, partial [Pseudoxanthomonas sp.]|nr:SpoIIE family protein phosphatase [Pseudoxanthomonas sp.]
PLGIEAHRDFPSWRGHLRPGDSLLAWTDGITEAFDAGDRAFGEDRLSAAVRADYIARENCERLVAAVHAFADGAPQSDDITVLAVRVDRAADNAELPREVAQC